MRRLRHAPKAPLAVAGILATPLFFVALMAFSLVLDKPSVDVTTKGAEVLGDPARATIAAIYLLSIGVSALVVLIGVLALLLPVRAAVFVPAIGAIGVTIALLLPLDTAEAEHTSRYPDGVDLIPRSDPVRPDPPRRVGGECPPNGQPDRPLDDRYCGRCDRGRRGS